MNLTRFNILVPILLATLSSLSGCKNFPLYGNADETHTETPNTLISETLNASKSVIVEPILPPPTETPSVSSLEAVTFWEDLTAEFQLDLTIENKRLLTQRKWYAAHPAYIKRVVNRSRPYIYYIYQQAKQRGIPAELVLLPIVESAFDPFAYSHGRASGIWQFIPGTAKAYGLKQTWWYDGRRDVKASTDAAFEYLTRLNKQFDGDWLLALAAYNSGGGTVRKAVRYNKKRGLATDFWSLKLPKETQAYVPKLLAISQIFNDPSTYNITLPEIKNQAVVAVVDTESQIDIAQAALLADMSIESMYTHNPGFNRWATDPDGPHQLLVPIEKANNFAVALASLPKQERVSWSRYKIKSGDSLILIAKRNRTTPALLKDINHLKSNRIIAGKTLLIPSAAQHNNAYKLSLEQRMKAKASRKIKGKRKEHHYVQPGESFWKIAKQYNVNTRSLAKWNGMAPTDPLITGKKLTLWVAQSNMVAAQRGQIRKVNYKARNGDSYARIADKFNVSVKQIQRWNKINLARYLQPGELLTLYVDITNAP
ncbi:lytic transglycosylase [Gammaproteobacteria bacterium 45_16_T64]|nr:lytic transglycosylase [Gammaproteobacteria bacterium 45_16_T64]